MRLDARVAQAVFNARLLEDALHDNGPWTMQWGPHEVPAHRVVRDRGVIFTASFPDSCYLERPPTIVTLRLRGEDRAIKHITDPGDGRFLVDWAISLPTVPAAA